MGSKNLEKIEFGRSNSGKSHIETIKGMAFYNTKIKELQIPNSVKTIWGSAVFSHQLTDFSFEDGSQLSHL